MAAPVDEVFTPPAFDQPEVPELPQPVDDEDEILAGNPEDAEIGKEPAPLTAAQTQVLQTQALLKIAESMQSMQQGQEKIRQKSYQEIKPDSPWNPEGRRDLVKLRGSVFQNGYPVNPMMMSEKQRIMANQLKPGRYVNRTVEVTRHADGGLNISWDNKRIDKRMEFNAAFPTFEKLCETLIAERKDKEERRKRGEFDTEEVL